MRIVGCPACAASAGLKHECRGGGWRRDGRGRGLAARRSRCRRHAARAVRSRPRAGASHGSSRIFRLAYAEAEYVRLAQRAHDLWRQLEQATGAAVLTISGAVDHGDPARSTPSTPRSPSAAAEAILAAGRGRPSVPGLRFDGDVLWHARAGRLHADHAVAACIRRRPPGWEPRSATTWRWQRSSRATAPP